MMASLSETKIVTAISNLLSRKYGNLPVYRSHNWKQSRYWFGDGTILFIYDVENHNVYVNKDHWLGRLGRLNALQTHEVKAIFRTFLANSYGLEVNDVWENDFSSREDQYAVTSPDYYRDDNKPILEHISKDVVLQWFMKYYGGLNRRQLINDNGDETLVYYNSEGKKIMEYVESSDEFYIRYNLIGLQLIAMFGFDEDYAKDTIMEFFRYKYDLPVFSAQWI